MLTRRCCTTPPRRNASDRVFVGPTGHPFSATTLRRYYGLAKTLAGISRRCRFHDLRHTFCSDLVSAGEGLSKIAASVGHSTTRMAERYSKPAEESLRPLARSLNARRDELKNKPSGVQGDGGPGGELGSTLSPPEG